MFRLAFRRELNRCDLYFISCDLRYTRFAPRGCGFLEMKYTGTAGRTHFGWMLLRNDAKETVQSVIGRLRHLGATASETHSR